MSRRRATSKDEVLLIALTRLGAHGESVWVNPDLIATMEAHPDTVLALTNGTKVVVGESVEEVVDRVRDWRASVQRAPLKPVGDAPTTRA